MTYPEAIQFLYSLRLFGVKLGLENTFKLAASAGNPHEKLRFIHVAGTQPACASDCSPRRTWSHSANEFR